MRLFRRRIRTSGRASATTERHCRRRSGELDERRAHLCIDMQRMFSEATPRQVNWMPRFP